jgi:putative copper export protein
VWVLTGACDILLIASSLTHSGLGDLQLWQKAGAIFSTTMLGAVSWLRLVLLILLLMLTFTSMTNLIVSRWIKFLILTALMVSFAFTGHAYSSESARALQLISHSVHMLAAAVWFGGLCGLMLQSYRLHRDISSLQLMNRLLKRFSYIALPMIILVSVSGLLLSLYRFGGWKELFTSLYGEVILCKIAVFLLTLVIAAYHRYLIIPRIENLKIDTEETEAKLFIHKLFQSIRTELLLAFVVILLAGILSTSPLPSA